MRARTVRRGLGLRLGLGLACVLACAPAFARAEEPQAPPLDLVRDDVGFLLPLKIDAGNLVFDRAAFQQATEAAAKQAADQWQAAHGQPIPKPPSPSDVVGQTLASMLRRSKGQDGSTVAKPLKTSLMEFDQTLSCTELFCWVRCDEKTYSLTLEEKAGPKRELTFDENLDNGTLVHVSDPAHKLDIHLVIAKDGSFGGECVRGDVKIPIEGKSFLEALKSDPAKVQVHFLRPLTDLGAKIAPHKFLPVVMAAATSGFGAPAPEHAQKVAALLEKLKGDDAAERDSATADLIKLFPFGVKFLKEQAVQAADAEKKARLAKVVGAHPGIAQVLPWVEAQKLHEDRAYLRDIFAHVPFFKAAAHQRLIEVNGKDYGENPADWPTDDSKK